MLYIYVIEQAVLKVEVLGVLGLKLETYVKFLITFFNFHAVIDN